MDIWRAAKLTMESPNIYYVPETCSLLREFQLTASTANNQSSPSPVRFKASVGTSGYRCASHIVAYLGKSETQVHCNGKPIPGWDIEASDGDYFQIFYPELDEPITIYYSKNKLFWSDVEKVKPAEERKELLEAVTKLHEQIGNLQHNVKMQMEMQERNYKEGREIINVIQKLREENVTLRTRMLELQKKPPTPAK